MGLLSILMMFLLSLFGLVASGMLMAKYNESEEDKNSTKYKFNIFLVVFFVLAVLGTIIAGAFGMKSSAPVMMTTSAGVPVAVSTPAQAAAVVAAANAANGGIKKSIPIEIK